MATDQVQIVSRVDREIVLESFLRNHLMPSLTERGYSLRNLLQALGSMAFNSNEKVVARCLWDAVANLDDKNNTSRRQGF